ncbi:MAG: hypothetical protein II816_05465, partial [Elusimicrobia bacterium]|nr:hypothetical protein [Elusimicrobiota bacterium]
ARENGKVAILSNGEWVQGELEVPYYVAESDVEDINGYLTQKVSERKFILKEGTVALANGAGGRILVYDNISPEIISDLQNAIDNIDIQYIIDCLEKYQKDSNIRQIVEYIFLQVVTDKTKAPITKILLAYGNDTQIGTKVAELSRVYINEKIEVLNSYLENERKIKDAAIRYSVINFIEKELDVLAYFYIDYEQAHDDIQNLINKVMKDNNITISAINKKVTGVIKRLNEILSEDDVSRYDKEELIKICQTAKVWNFYGNAYLRKLVLKADEISDKHDGTDYSTEINKFADISAKDLSKYGSKTTELANIVRLFIKKDIRTAKVPDGIGVSKDVLRIFFEHADKKDEYLRLAADFEQAIKNKDKKQALRIGSQISRMIADSDDGQLKQYLEKELKQGTKYTVRSSGIGEDGQNHAFAGMAETKLNVDSNNVYECVKLCWQSFYSPVCIEDMLKENVVVLPAILIQEMVSDVKKAGVIFSRDNGGDLTIEAVLGLGEGLVSGRITPDHISVKASDGTIRYRRALNGMIKVEENVSGGTKVSKLTRDEKIERILDEQTIKTLNKIAYVLEEDSGYPIDIEFAIDDSGQIFVLQRRAITSLDMKIGEQLPEVSPKIEQSIVVNAVEALSLLDQIVDEAEQVFKNLFNLPEDIDERYSAVVEQIYTIVNLIKKYNRAGYSLQYPLRDDTYGEVSAIQTKLKDFCDRNGLNNFGSFMISDFMICVLAGFVQIKNISSDNLFFYTIIDTLFSDYKGEARKDINIINDVSM